MRLRWLLIPLVGLISCVESDSTEAPSDADFEVQLSSVIDDLSVPLVVTEPDDGSDRLFVVDQPGQVLVVGPDGEKREEPFLDVSGRMVDIDPSYDERGLLGLAFHPDFEENGRLFVYYSAPLRDGAPEGWDHTSHVSEFTVSGDRAFADPDSERIILQVDQPYSNHNAGQITFGPDGYLYIPLGDGGDGGDTDADGEDLGRPDAGNGQTTDTLLGSILRLDVDGEEPYAIPDDNVFAGTNDGADEIFAYGFRNPYGMSFDLETGDIFVADAGQARFEEVSRVEPGGNHGWNIKEATHCFDPDNFLESPENCPDTGSLGEPLVDPVVEYERGPESGSVVVPAVMYRGSTVPELSGQLVFGDYGSIRYLPTGVLYRAEPRQEGLWEVEEMATRASGEQGGGLERFLLGVDQDLAGEMYLLTTREGGPTGSTGEVFLISSGAARSVVASWLIWVAAAVLMVAGVVAAVLVGVRRRAGESQGGTE